MRRKIFLSTISFFAIMILNLGFQPAFAGKMVIKLATSSPINNITLTKIEGAGLSTEHSTAVVFKRIVEARTKGEIEVKIFPNSQLGDEPELYQQVQDGTIQMTTASCVSLASRIPEWMAFTAPYLVGSPEVLMMVLEGPAGQKFIDLAKKKAGMRFLGFAPVGFRQFMNSKKVIKSPADLAGMKMRVMQTPEMVKLVEGFGAQAVPISWPELYTSLQQGVVDGGDIPISMGIQANLYEVQKFVTMDGHRLDVFPLVINEEFFQGLAPEQRSIIQDAAKQALVVFRGQLYIGNTLWVEHLQKELKVNVYWPTADELKQFKETAQKAVVPYIRSQIGDEWVDLVLSEVKKAESIYNAQ